MLIKTRYPENFSIGLLTSSGSLGLLFPTSVPAILYCVYSQTPLPRLFTGAILPELLMISCVAAVGIRMGLKNNAVREPFSFREAGSAIWNAKWELALPVIMIVGLFGGFGTLTEAAALTAFCAFIVEVFIYRDLKITRDYREVFVECATIVGGILLILGVALGFTNYLIDAEVPSRLIEWVQAHVESKYLFLLLLNLALLVVGAMMDIFAAILVVVPLLKPLAARLRHRPGADGRDLHRQSRAGLPASAGRHQPVPLRLSLQEAHGHDHLGHAAVPVHPDGQRPADHLRPVADAGPAALVRPVDVYCAKRLKSWCATQYGTCRRRKLAAEGRRGTRRYSRRRRGSVRRL